MWLIGFFLSWFFWWLQDPPADLPTDQLEAKDQGADVSHEAAQDNWWYIGWGTGEGCYSAKKNVYIHMEIDKQINEYRNINMYVYIYI